MSVDRPLVLVLHGARGDLSRRMVLPALATLQRRGLLPERWALLGTGREPISGEEFDALLRDAVDEFGSDADRAGARELTRHTAYAGDVSDDDTHDELPGALDRLRRALVDGTDLDPQDVLVVHYLAVPPSSFAPITRALHRAGLHEGIRVVYEKPYGTSPESFRELDAVVHEVLDEQQVFRIDHFLGKEATQNLHVSRFANELLGGAWDRHHVAQVQVDVPETLDVAHRAGFYDATGAALDMLVTHLFQVAAEVAMDPPTGLSADDLTAAREDVIAHFRPLDPGADVVLGQFEGYRELDGVPDDSTTDTFVAARLWVDTDRWRGVPFLLRTGKRMAASAQQVTLVLRSPSDLFGEDVGPNRVEISLAGSGAVRLTTTVKRPGPDLALATGTATLRLEDVEPEGDPLPPYAGLLQDVLEGDRTLFTTPRGLESAWRAFEPLLGDARPDPLPYRPGSWGPVAADALAEPHGWALRD
ncbi:glucose-6-phosphate 1-dehydrogenase [Cellulomonas fimi]|uniref:Glucose-6-phosphate 1-dehydrogenase n=1 Tax=Cellulomonas fimi (strain ATCC 484 / DSM 20113 / JCM 1341 / CCUG 24087 / LMG 16345 / NBRC 15513 / NCIMB 8980 / NCTC 7547 / NRS-133) TaxID=590998 RepID=F4H319_CELFA|nr:glucose-6-phosphate 1-dehydrogenase [Cellulomonas fimi]AEE47637.1 glucose-6-phosphate dehydrogenase [Cellulomonas fimi ATCC 484]NNH08630.1 glucose-6-phosphate dehydrogenase [Cellulomonas fimi]VEH36694.1 Glucose-6-phosphate 1-dehydrogenase [Cellulomonas fimi]